MEMMSIIAEAMMTPEEKKIDHTVVRLPNGKYVKVMTDYILHGEGYDRSDAS